MKPLGNALLIAGSAAALVLGSFTAAAPAWAGPNCPSGFHCVMRDDINDNQFHDYFNSDRNFTDDTFSNGGGVVNENVSAASNSSTGGFESHYYYNVSPVGSANWGALAFCVNPGSHAAGLFSDGIRGNGIGQNDEASALRLRPTTTVPCF